MRGFRILATLTAAAAWALVAVGGVVRASESGLGCPDWPLCNGRVVPAAGRPAVEVSHRWTAATVTLLVLATAILALRRHRARRDIVVPAVLAALTLPVVAALGAIVVLLELPGWLVGVHFVLGMLLLAATVTTAMAAWKGGRGAPMSAGFRRLALWSVGAGFALVAAGAAVVSLGADSACGREWPSCNGTFVAGPAEAWVQVAHRSLAYVVAAMAVALFVLSVRGRGPRVLGTVPLTVVTAQMGFGIALVLTPRGTGAHPYLEALHVAGAGAVWASLVALAAVAARADVAAPSRRPAAAPVHSR